MLTNGTQRGDRQRRTRRFISSLTARDRATLITAIMVIAVSVTVMVFSDQLARAIVRPAAPQAEPPPDTASATANSRPRPLPAPAPASKAPPGGPVTTLPSTEAPRSGNTPGPLIGPTSSSSSSTSAVGGPSPQCVFAKQSVGADATVSSDRSLNLQTGHVDQSAVGVRLRYEPRYRILVAIGDGPDAIVGIRPLNNRQRFDQIRPQTLPTLEQKPFDTVLSVARLVSQRVAQVYIDNRNGPDGVAVIEIQRHEPGRAVMLRWVLYARACG